MYPIHTYTGFSHWNTKSLMRSYTKTVAQSVSYTSQTALCNRRSISSVCRLWHPVVLIVCSMYPPVRTSIQMKFKEITWKYYFCMDLFGRYLTPMCNQYEYVLLYMTISCMIDCTARCTCVPPIVEPPNTLERGRGDFCHKAHYWRSYSKSGVLFPVTVELALLLSAIAPINFVVPFQLAWWTIASGAFLCRV